MRFALLLWAPAMPLRPIALAIFCFFFLFVTLAGFWAARWRRPAAACIRLKSGVLPAAASAHGLHGSSSAAISTPPTPSSRSRRALRLQAPFGFFAVPYAVIAYPYMMVVMPRLWRVCHRHGYVTFADFVAGRYGNRWLAVAIALTGILALMPYIALQLVGMKVVLSAMGLAASAPLVHRLRHPRRLHLLQRPARASRHRHRQGHDALHHGDRGAHHHPLELGGYARVFQLANQALATHTPAGTIFLKPSPVPRLLHAGHRQRHRVDALPPHGHRRAQREGRATSFAATPPCCPPIAFCSA